MATGLLVIDLQCGMFGSPHDGDAVLSRVAGLISRARARGVPVLHVRHDGGPGDLLERGARGWDIHPDVAPQDTEPVIDKENCSAFLGTDLHDRLRARSISRLIIAGMQTEYCIDATCRAAHGLGYGVALVADGHTTFDSEMLPAERIIAHHNLTLERGAFVDLIEAATVRF